MMSKLVNCLWLQCQMVDTCKTHLTEPLVIYRKSSNWNIYTIWSIYFHYNEPEYAEVTSHFP